MQISGYLYLRRCLSAPIYVRFTIVEIEPTMHPNGLFAIWMMQERFSHSSSALAFNDRFTELYTEMT